MVKAHFKDIHIEIINLIETAQTDIKICVAWFTDFDIYSKIVAKQKQGVNVDVVIANHIFNKKSRVDFKEFLKHSGKVSYIGNINDGSQDKFMHNKFCIIDNSTIVTGSYNWSFKARSNDENILIIKNEQELVNQFIDKFNDLKPQYGFAIKGNEISLQPIEKIMAKWDNKLKKTQKLVVKKSTSTNITSKF
jgi:phosphatidylserine/phosphatidylglycerophosphate/cardiolipin synthase-like enzyme